MFLDGLMSFNCNSKPKALAYLRKVDKVGLTVFADSSLPTAETEVCRELATSFCVLPYFNLLFINSS